MCAILINRWKRRVFVIRQVDKETSVTNRFSLFHILQIFQRPQRIVFNTGQG